uniref:EthD domain-containing protein n=1 Tax=Talaromyces marneffei PM1 TaxID=1077442 RepID=A0A093VIQ6_TALMA
MSDNPAIPPRPSGDPHKQFLCLTICGYKQQGMSEEDYRHHMQRVSAPMTKDLMVKYGVKRWTQIHNQEETRALMKRLFDHQMANLADFDCFSQVVFKDVDQYKRMKDDPWYREHLVGDHEKFADTQRSAMTIGWITEFVRDGEVVDGMKDHPPAQASSARCHSTPDI